MVGGNYRVGRISCCRVDQRERGGLGWESGERESLDMEKKHKGFVARGNGDKCSQLVEEVSPKRSGGG